MTGRRISRKPCKVLARQPKDYNRVDITREHVLQALATVPVDAAGTNLGASGRLSEVVIDAGGRVMFAIAITPPEADAMERVRQAAETAVQGLPGVKGVFASLTADKPGGGGPSTTPPAHPARPESRPAVPPPPRRRSRPGGRRAPPPRRRRPCLASGT